MRARFLAISTLLAGVALVVARSAGACLDILCADTGTHAGPANAGVLLHVDRVATGTPVFSLRDASDAEVPVTITPEGHVAGVFVVRPSGALVAGRYVARAPSCDADERASELVDEPDAPPPTALGGLRLGEPRTEEGRHGCISSPPAKLREIDLSLDVDPSLVRWLPITVIELRVGGAAYRDPELGARPTLGFPATTLRADCSGSDARYLSPKVHEVEVRAFVAGSSTPLRATTEVDLRCPEPAQPAPEKNESAGCTAFGSGPSGHGVVVTGAAFFARTLRRRRRPR